LAKGDPSLHRIPGSRRFVPATTEDGKIVEADGQDTFDYGIASFQAAPHASAKPAKAPSGKRQYRTFPIGSTKTPAASSFRGLSTRADTCPVATLAPRPASKNLQESRPSLRVQ